MQQEKSLDMQQTVIYKEYRTACENLPLAMDRQHPSTSKKPYISNELSYMNVENERPLVLVIDDEEYMRLLIDESLDQAGFDVVEAGNGEQGLQVFQERNPDIVLMDVMMPGKNGFETCTELRTIVGGEHVPVLMITGLDDVDSINRAYAAGATDFITKPINYTLLGHRVRYLLRASEAINNLITSERRLANAQRIAKMGYWDWDTARDELQLSQQVYKILDIPPDRNREQRISSFDSLLTRVHDNDKIALKEWFELACKNGDVSSITHRIVTSKGVERFIRQQVEILTEQDQVLHLYGTLQDITELRQAEERIHRLAYYDSLTGLPNREFFKERVDWAIKLAKRHESMLALLFLDLNNFKRINDTLGHSIGDMLLKATAERLKHSLRASDSISRSGHGMEADNLARLGGDEFTVLLSEISRAEDAGWVAERVIESISQPLMLAGHEVCVGTSIGIAIFPGDGDNAEVLLKNADMAMYYAKRDGKKHCQYYSESMNGAALRRLTMENNLRKAIERNELSLVYQPQLDIASNRICGVEALLRWDSAELGRISPEDFIPLAEETGLIFPISEWVLRTACEQTMKWLKAGHKLERTAINISPIQFSDSNFCSLIKTVLNDTGMTPELLELEVTEGLLMKDADRAVETLKWLKDIGVQIAIDDFGTGYSSLSYLKQFPIDRLKIDQVFVQEINTNTDDAAIATAVIAMAGSMDLKVIAEGVEDQEQFSFLKKQRCDEVQGYYLSKPIGSVDMDKFLQEQDASPYRISQ